MKVYLGVGSNLGARRQNIVAAIAALETAGMRAVRSSPVVESPALLPAGAQASWNRPFLNVVLEAETEGHALDWLPRLKQIEDDLGREKTSRWAPRTLDIDILTWGEQRLDTDALVVPHPEMHKRAFVLSPLLHLAPTFRIPGFPHKSLLQWTSELPGHIPLWMGIVNVTPDSFSDAGQHAVWEGVEPFVREMIDAGVHIIDLGAESTRPGATPVSPEAEWARLEPVLSGLFELLQNDPLRPKISVDTRHVLVAERALGAGVDMLNDVTGLSSARMRSLARESGVDWVAMHHLSIPARRDVVLAPEADPVAELQTWLRQQLETWSNDGLDLDRIFFDPGIGFGKDALHSLELLRHCGRFRELGLRLLVGHSRKSFLAPFADAQPRERDLETIGASLALCGKGVDVLRVHNVPVHLRAYRGWSHVRTAVD